MGTLQAGNKQHGHANRDHHGKNTAIRRDPIHQVLHCRLPNVLKDKNSK
jgi:hypothetical protein